MLQCMPAIDAFGVVTDAATDASVAPMAMLTSAAASADRSLMPSPQKSVVHCKPCITWALGYCITWAVGHDITWAIGILHHMGIWTLRHVGTGILHHMGTWTLHHMGIRTLHHMGTWILQHMGTALKVDSKPDLHLVLADHTSDTSRLAQPSPTIVC